MTAMPHLFELGFPYSDPIADGPVIQASYTRVLEKGIKVSEILAMASRTLPSLGMPTVLFETPEGLREDLVSAGLLRPGPAQGR